VYNYIGLVVILFCLIIFLPASKLAMAQYHLSDHEYHVLLFVVDLPYVLMWFSAFYGYQKLRAYTSKITNTKEGEVFQGITSGSHWLAWGYVIPVLASLIMNAIANKDHGFYDTSLILANYFNLIFPVIAYTIIATGAHKLIEKGKVKMSALSVKFIILVFVLIGVIYCYLTFRRLDIVHPGSSDNPYYLPVWLLLASIVVPYLYAWFCGLIAIFQFTLFTKQVKGIIYKRGLLAVAVGIVLVIASSIGVQFLHSVIPRTGHLSLSTILVTNYIFYLCIIIGFLLVSYGSTQLKKIEDI
jgi:hypothetical protein